MASDGRRDTSAAGQVVEFLVWAALIAQSRGALHVFLPLLDRGLDGVVHRLTDGAYLPVQVKGRSSTREGSVTIVVRADALVDDDAWMICALQEAGRLGEQVLVVRERDFKRLAERSVFEGHDVYEAIFSMHPHASRWGAHLLPRERLAEPLAGGLAGEPVRWPAPQAPLAPFERSHSWLGFLGEAEVLRRLAESPRLDLFRPFPDLETVEVLARSNERRGWCGIQVKTGTVAERPHRLHASIRRSSFVAAPSTYVAVLAWEPAARAFHRRCLWIPSERVLSVAAVDGQSYEIVFDPDEPRRTKLDPYRVDLASLPDLVERACATYASAVASGGEDLKPAPATPAVKVIEACIAARHVVAVRYVNAAGVEETLRVRPLAIRTNKSHHLVVWVDPKGRDHLEELRLDRVVGAEDTGEAFG